MRGFVSQDLGLLAQSFRDVRPCIAGRDTTAAWDLVGGLLHDAARTGCSLTSARAHARRAFGFRDVVAAYVPEAVPVLFPDAPRPEFVGARAHIAVTSGARTCADALLTCALTIGAPADVLDTIAARAADVDNARAAIVTRDAATDTQACARAAVDALGAMVDALRAAIG